MNYESDVLEVRGSQLLRGSSPLEVGPMRVVTQKDSSEFLVQFVLDGEGASAKLQGSFNRHDWGDLINSGGSRKITQSGFYYYSKVPTVIRAVATCPPGAHVRAYA